MNSNDIAIVATSCLLSGAKNPDEFWDICLNEKSQVRTISDGRLRKFLYCEDADPSTDKIYTKLACEIQGDRFDFLPEKFKADSPSYNRLHSYILNCMEQLKSKTRFPESRRVDMILGNMNPDTDHELKTVSDEKQIYMNDLLKKFSDKPKKDKDWIRECVNYTIDQQTIGVNNSPWHFFVSHVLNTVKNSYQFKGEFHTVDAACASSIVALEIAAQRLKLGLCDCAIAGGAESNLGNGTYIIFSKVGALAKNHSLPFDRRSEGLVQSEGAVLFVLKRIEDALNDKDQILGVIRSISGNSDGRSASLFQPNVDGQMRVYKNIYPSLRQLDYLEAHGTGTQVGDEVEKTSVSVFFKGHRFPVGSTKALFGHTKGAAGATGILKVLCAMEKKIIPGSKYCEESLFTESEDSPYINREPIRLSEDRPLRMGVNSFGFGGTNYHVLIEEWQDSSKVLDTKSYAPIPIYVVSEASMDITSFEKKDFLKQDFPFKLPPKSVEAIDKTQLGALLTAWNCIQSIGPIWKTIPKNKINVVSACTLFLEQGFEIMARLTYEIIASHSEKEMPENPFNDELREYVNESIRSQYSPLNEDSATGVLNNVIAGRVCNIFDLHGKSYNIDKDLASIPVCLEAIKNDLIINPDQLYIFIGVNEELSADQLKTQRNGVSARILTTEEFALSYELPLKGTLSLKGIST